MKIAITYPKISILICLFVFGAMCIFIPKIRTINNVDYFEIKDSPTTRFYEYFKKIFGNDEFFVIAYTRKDFFSPSNLKILKILTQKIENSPYVRKVLSLANVDYIMGGNDFFEVDKFLEHIPSTLAECIKLKQKAITNPLYRDSLISRDGNTGAIVVFSKNREGDPDYREKLLKDTWRILAPYEGKISFHLAGWTVTNFALSRYMKSDLKKFIPLTYLLILIVIWLFFRNITLVVLALLNISVCMASTMGFFGLTHVALHNVTSIVPPLIMSMSLADTVHIFSHLDINLLNQGRYSAMTQVLEDVTLPCFLTTLTTALGFISLSVSRLSPIRDFAYMASAGMVFEFFYAFFLLPPLLVLLPQRLTFTQGKGETTSMKKFLKGLYSLLQKYATPITIFFFIAMIFCFFFAKRVKIETDLNNFFMPSTREYKDLHFVESHLSGTASMDIYFATNQTTGFKNPYLLKKLDQVEQFSRGIKGVDVALGFSDYLKEMNKAFHNNNPKYYILPSSIDMVSQYLLLIDHSTIGDFVTEDYKKSRISLRLSKHSSRAQEKIIQKLRFYLVKHLRHIPSLYTRITGRAMEQVEIIDALVKSQMESLLLAGITISIIMIVLFGSIFLGILSLLPNIFPIMLNFAIMGIVGITLNTATALISAVAIGIAVDDTIHFLTTYQRNRKKGKGIKEATSATMLHKGHAMIVSSIILFFGFCVLVTSSFRPTFEFGLLTSIIMLSALIGDLIFLPAILLMGDYLFGKKS